MFATYIVIASLTLSTPTLSVCYDLLRTIWLPFAVRGYKLERKDGLTAFSEWLHSHFTTAAAATDPQPPQAHILFSHPGTMTKLLMCQLRSTLIMCLWFVKWEGCCVVTKSLKCSAFWPLFLIPVNAGSSNAPKPLSNQRGHGGNGVTMKCGRRGRQDRGGNICDPHHRNPYQQGSSWSSQARTHTSRTHWPAILDTGQTVSRFIFHSAPTASSWQVISLSAKWCYIANSQAYTSCHLHANMQLE